MRFAPVFLFAACSSSSPPPAQPETPPPPPVDAAIVEIDAAPDITLSAPAHVFRFTSATRSETWTLWFASGVAVLTVQPTGGALVRYQGTATDGETLLVDVASSTAKMKLDCKRTKREVDGSCDPAAQKAKPKAKPKAKKQSLDALDCFHADFEEPMPFGPAPGIEYVADGVCAGYHAL